MGKKKNEEITKEKIKNTYNYLSEFLDEEDDNSCVHNIVGDPSFAIIDEAQNRIIKIVDELNKLENLFIKYNVHYSDPALRVVKWHLQHIYSDYCIRDHDFYLKGISDRFVNESTKNMVMHIVSPHGIMLNE